MSKGNYDEGFGREQHKEKWNSRTASRNPTSSSEESAGEETEAVPRDAHETSSIASSSHDQSQEETA